MLNPEQYQHSEESRGFRQEFEMRKVKQVSWLHQSSSLGPLLLDWLTESASTGKYLCRCS